MATPSIRTILVPLDFEAASLAALDRAVALAAHLGARVVPLHVHVPPDPNPGLVDRVLEHHREPDRASVARAAAAVQRRWGLAVEHRRGAPISTILQTIDELDADLVVMGSPARGDACRLLFGSVAERVVRKSEVPVLLVRPEVAAPPSPVVLCATDLGAGSAAVLERARSLADAMGARLEVVHAYCIPLGAYPSFEPGLVSQVVDEVERWATVELASAARRVGATRHHLTVGNPAEAILEMARQLNPLLVVLGTRQRRGVARLYMGSVAEWVARRSPHPVLMVPCEYATPAPTVGASAPLAAARR